MDTCIVIPDELSLVLTLHPNPKNILEMNVALWSNTTLPVGAKFTPDDGKVRLDKLEVYSHLAEDDPRNQFGSQDTITVVEDREVRHCNWVRFLKYSTSPADVNIVGIKIKDEIIFQTVKKILPNEEIVAYLQDPAAENTPKFTTYEPNKVKTEPDDSEKTIVPTSTTRDLLTSPLSRDDDCKSSISDGLQSDDETEANDQESSPQTSSTERYSEPEISPDTTRPMPIISSLLLTPPPAPYSSGSSPATSPDSALDLSSPRTSLTSPLASSLTSPPTSYSLGRSPLDLTSPKSTSSVSLSDHALTLTPPTRVGPPRPKRNRERTWLPCEVCGKKFDRPSLLKRHMRTHTGEKPHACDVCGKAFSTSSSLNTHRRIHSGEKPHQCGICGKRFTASSNLYYHRMTHSKEKPHKCTMCEKSFPTPGDLRSHMYVHDGSWPFRCDVCNRGFSKQTNLKNHLLLHTGDKPHECPVCLKKFALQCNLKTHLKTHEDDDQGSCISCGRTYLKKDDVTSSKCSDCIRNSDPSSTSGVKRHLSDFSISKLTNSDDSNKDYKRMKVQHSEVYDPRFSMYSPAYSPVHYGGATGGHYFSSQERFPLGYIPVYSSLSPEANSSQVGRMVPSFSQGLHLAESVYQTSRVAMLNGWPGLMAK